MQIWLAEWAAGAIPGLFFIEVAQGILRTIQGVVVGGSNWQRSDPMTLGIVRLTVL